MPNYFTEMLFLSEKKKKNQQIKKWSRSLTRPCTDALSSPKKKKNQGRRRAVHYRLSLTRGCNHRTNCCLLFGLVVALCDCLLEVVANGGSYVVKIF